LKGGEYIDPSQFWEFPCNCWIDQRIELEAKQQVAVPLPSLDEVDYEIEVETSEWRHSGTDASVWAIFHGDRGTSPKIPFDKDFSFQLLENSKALFKIRIPPLGHIHKVELFKYAEGKVFPNWSLNT
jgi:hypothetical protein